MPIMGAATAIPCQNAQEIRIENAQRRQESKSFRRLSREQKTRRGFLCPGCGRWEDVHGRYAGSWASRLWPCTRCGQGGEPPELMYLWPLSGQVMNQQQYEEFLNKS